MRVALKEGSFYWVRPEFDVDFVPPGFEGREFSDALHKAAWNHWTQQEQPARFCGYDGATERWLFIGQDESDGWWPVCWVGDEIVR